MMCFLDLLRQKQIELETERVRLEQLRLQFPRGGSSGLHTPSTRNGTGSSTPRNKSRSVGYYFDKLGVHFYGNNDANRFSITCTKFLCQVYDGKNVVHSVDVDQNDSTSVRNLYLMFYASEYNAAIFLEKFNSGEFEDFDGSGLKTPPEYDTRSNVYVLL